jgi:hypothetical protein
VGAGVVAVDVVPVVDPLEAATGSAVLVAEVVAAGVVARRPPPPAAAWLELAVWLLDPPQDASTSAHRSTTASSL